MSLSLSLFFLLITFSLYTSSVNSNSYDENSVEKACPPHYCGEMTIKYPFRLQDDATSDRYYCGYKGFGLNCTAQNQTILSLQNEEDYYVKSINYTDYTLNLVDVDVTTNQTCPRARHNLTIEHLPLYYSSLDMNFTFYFNCSSGPPPPNPPVLPIECLGLGVNRSYVSMMGSEPDGYYDWYEYCEEKVVATVIEREINYVSDFTNLFGGVMNEGFILNWGQMEGCYECEESDGACGCDQRTQNFVCFCSGGNINNKNCRGRGSRMLLKLILAGASAAGVGLLVTCIIIYCIRSKTSSCGKLIIFWKKKTRDDLDLESFLRQYGSLAPKRFSYFDVKKMTNSFKDKLGEGGYGGVYKGKLLDGTSVAVKILKKSKGNGEEFINEVASISRTSHVNVVTLLGFCLEGNKRALLYEFMPNGSLEKYIYSSKNTSGHLGWEKMDQIVIGIARGLEYLHRGCNTRILHFDIKPHNILLDEDFHPKIADFGLAKLCTTKQSIVSMLEARGTIGYIAPEVFNRNFGGVSHKSDVYSFGMMVLEMVGAKNKIDVPGSHSSEIYFPQWVYRRLELDQDLLSHVVMTREESEIVRKMIVVGLWCIQTDPLQRPSMSKVIDMLKGSIEDLKIPPKPFISSPPRSPQDSSSTLMDTIEEL